MCAILAVISVSVFDLYSMARRIEVIDLDSDDDINPPLRAREDTSEVEALFEELRQGQGKLDLRNPQAMNDEQLPGFDVAHGFAYPFAHGQNGILEQQRAGESISAQHTLISGTHSGTALPEDQNAGHVSPAYGLCLTEILELFPDISHDHVEQLYNSDVQRFSGHGMQNSLVQHLIEKILESGKYPKEKDRLKELKRKRYRDSDEEEIAQLQNAQSGDIGYGLGGYATYA